MKMYQMHRDTAPVVRKLCIEIANDVPFWKRRRFRNACEKYLAMTDDQLKAKAIPDDEARKKQWSDLRQSIKNRLEDIANAS